MLYLELKIIVGGEVIINFQIHSRYETKIKYGPRYNKLSIILICNIIVRGIFLFVKNNASRTI